jgi:DNA-binding CsgD family transcriptional regulator
MTSAKTMPRAPVGMQANRLTFAGADFLVLSFPVTDPPASRLTAAEADVVRQIVMGRSNQEIAACRGTAVRTVVNQVAVILRKLGARSRYDVVAQLALRNGRRVAAKMTMEGPSQCAAI